MVHSNNLCLLVGVFRQLTFKAIIDIVELIPTIIVIIFHFMPLFFLPVFIWKQHFTFLSSLKFDYSKILPFIFIFLKILFIYLSERGRKRERERREHKQGEWQAEGEAGSPLSKEPDVGLNHRTLGS